MVVGLVGEAPTDTKAIEVLLFKKYDNITFIELLRNINGAQLENQKTKQSLRLECNFHKPNIVIFIRDLDGLLSKEYRSQILQRQNYYKEFRGSTQIKDKTIFLLNIWEIEALILADINAFNKYYKCNIKFNENPMKIVEPKEFLKLSHKKYSESDNKDIFLYSDFDKIYNNCSYFKSFINEFDEIVSKLLVTS